MCKFKLALERRRGQTLSPLVAVIQFSLASGAHRNARVALALLYALQLHLCAFCEELGAETHRGQTLPDRSASVTRLALRRAANCWANVSAP